MVYIKLYYNYLCHSKINNLFFYKIQETLFLTNFLIHFILKVFKTLNLNRKTIKKKLTKTKKVFITMVLINIF
jgi:hypothetical protein